MNRDKSRLGHPISQSICHLNCISVCYEQGQVPTGPPDQPVYLPPQLYLCLLWTGTSPDWATRSASLSATSTVSLSVMNRDKSRLGHPISQSICHLNYRYLCLLWTGTSPDWVTRSASLSATSTVSLSVMNRDKCRLGHPISQSICHLNCISVCYEQGQVPTGPPDQPVYLPPQLYLCLLWTETSPDWATRSASLSATSTVSLSVMNRDKSRLGHPISQSICHLNCISVCYEQRQDPTGPPDQPVYLPPQLYLCLLWTETRPDWATRSASLSATSTVSLSIMNRDKSRLGHPISQSICHLNYISVCYEQRQVATWPPDQPVYLPPQLYLCLGHPISQSICHLNCISVCYEQGPFPTGPPDQPVYLPPQLYLCLLWTGTIPDWATRSASLSATSTVSLSVMNRDKSRLGHPIRQSICHLNCISVCYEQGQVPTGPPDQPVYLPPQLYLCLLWTGTSADWATRSASLSATSTVSLSVMNRDKSRLGHTISQSICHLNCISVCYEQGQVPTGPPDQTVYLPPQLYLCLLWTGTSPDWATRSASLSATSTVSLSVMNRDKCRLGHPISQSICHLNCISVCYEQGQVPTGPPDQPVYLPPHHPPHWFCGVRLLHNHPREDTPLHPHVHQVQVSIHSRWLLMCCQFARLDKIRLLLDGNCTVNHRIGWEMWWWHLERIEIARGAFISIQKN